MSYINNLAEGRYWVTIGLKEKAHYINVGKTQIQIFDRINITSVEPEYILHRSSNIELQIHGNFGALKSYFAVMQTMRAIKILLDGFFIP